MEGIDKLAAIIELIKKKKKTQAQVQYQTYSKMPKAKAKAYIDELEKRVLKGDVDVGNISDTEIELFNEKPSEEDAVKAKKENKIKMIIGVVVFIVFFATCYNIMNTESGPPSKFSACHMAEQFMEKTLKSPSTADFASCSDATITDLGECKWEVSSYVDAQNGFGATVRTYFTATVQNKGCSGDTWTLISLY